MRKALLAVGMIACVQAASALDLDVGVSTALSAGGAESFIGVGYGVMGFTYREPGTKLTGSAPGWFVSFGSWLSPYLGLDARLGASETASLGRFGVWQFYARTPAWYGLYLRPQWTGSAIALHALAGFSDFQFERTALDPTANTLQVDGVRHSGFSFGAGIAFAPSVDLQLGVEWLAIARNAGLGPAVSSDISLLSGYLLFSF